ncbi:MAG: hypothetical protein R3F51_26710 [Cyanobacteriota/Melainabacteria group bacterium]
MAMASLPVMKGRALPSASSLFGERLGIGFGIVVTGFEKSDVLVDNFLTFVEKVSERTFVGPSMPIWGKMLDRTDSDGVLHNRLDRAVFLGNFLGHFLHRNSQDLNAFTDQRVFTFDPVAIKDNHAAFFNFGSMTLDGILIEGDERVEAITVRIKLFSSPTLTLSQI